MITEYQRKEADDVARLFLGYVLIGANRDEWLSLIFTLAEHYPHAAEEMGRLSGQMCDYNVA